MKKILKFILIKILSFEAKIVLLKYKPRIIAVTGNVGKTSAKDAIHAIISETYTARKSEKSFNSEIGVPLTVLGCPNGWSSPIVWFFNVLYGLKLIFSKRNYPEYLVLEVGADHPRDITKISKWLVPDIVVLTRMSPVPVHVENFKGGTEEVLREKMALVKGMKENGTIVINADDEMFVKETENFKQKKIFYGKSVVSSVKIDNVSAIYSESPLSPVSGQKIEMSVNGEKFSIDVRGVVGEHLAYPFASAMAVASLLGIKPDLESIVRSYEPPRGRMRVLPGINQSVIIDDTYNSSPLAVKEALRTIDHITARGKKIAVLGDMKELGEFSKKQHEEIGQFASRIVHTLVCVGDLASDIAHSAELARLSSERIRWHKTASGTAGDLLGFIRAGDVILVKGSQSMRMEKIVKEILDKSVRPEDVLVRQEKEWLNKE